MNVQKNEGENSHAAMMIDGHNFQMGGSNHAPITLLSYHSSRPKLPVRSVSVAEKIGAREPLWIATPTAEEAESPLSRYGIVVIEGKEGTGRLTSAIRSLESRIRKSLIGSGYPDKQLDLFQVSADWGAESDLEQADLPDAASYCGYLLDLTGRSISISAARVLVAWADHLRGKESFLAVISDLGTWPREDGLDSSRIESISPDPLKIVSSRLQKSGHSARILWIGVNPPEEQTRFPMFGKNNVNNGNDSPGFGIFREIISPELSPGRAVQIAEDIGKLDSEEVEGISRDSVRAGSKEQARAEEKLSRLRGRLGQWTHYLEPKIADLGTRGRDRALLVASAYMEGAQVEGCIDLGSSLGARTDIERTRRSREGRSPRKRMQDLGISITSEDRVSFSDKPGFADEAIRLDWFHWPEEREETVSWILDITKDKGRVSFDLRRFGDRILALTRSEPATGPLLRIVREWAYSESDDHVRESARLLVKAESSSRLAKETDEKMRQWAQADSTGLRRSVALACAQGYGKWEPNKALIRLRWILHNKKVDDATTEAMSAFRKRAFSGKSELLRATKALEKWFEEYHPDSPAAPRAFLALVDPDVRETNLLPGLLSSARSDRAVYGLLVHFWELSLDHPDVHEYAYKVLSGWMQGAYEGTLSSNLVYQIIEDVQKSRTPRDALARLLYGDPETENPALVEARKNLARGQCVHVECAHSNCPFKEDVSGHGAQSEVSISEEASSPVGGASDGEG